VSPIQPSEASVPEDVFSKLGEAIKAAAPGVDLTVWLEPVHKALVKCDATTPRRISAWLGQASQEAGQSFQEIEENLYYTTPALLCKYWPGKFPTLDSTEGFLRNPEALANRAYADKLGNGDEASGDGYRFRGGGLVQLTGKDEHGGFATSRGLTLEQEAAFVRTPEGAADTLAYYWEKHECNVLADGWQISNITRAINGNAMLGNAQRIAASNKALAVFGV